MADTNPLGGRPYGDLSSSYLNNNYLIGELQKQSTVAAPTGNAQVSAAASNLGQAGAYESGILSGDRSTVLATAAPEISSLLSAYDNSRKAAGQLTPRGGGRSQILNELPYKEAGDVNALVQKARPQAAQQLAKVGEAEGYLGATEQQLAQNDVNSSLSFLLGKAGVQLDWAKFNQANSQDLGKAIGQAIPQLIQAYMASGGGA